MGEKVEAAAAAVRRTTNCSWVAERSRRQPGLQSETMSADEVVAEAGNSVIIRES